MTRVRRTIRTRLILLVLASTLLPLSVGLALVVVADARALEADMVTRQKLIAQVVGEYSVADLAANDRHQSQITLGKLSSLPEIEYAAVFDAHGARFASYGGNGGGDVATVPLVAADTETSAPGHVDLLHPIEQGGVHHGSIYVRASTEALAQRVRRYAWSMVAVGIGVVLASLGLALVLQRGITRPILGLVEVARKIREEDDYDVRAVKTSSDEVGALCDGFNAMLSTLERRRGEQRFLLETTGSLSESLDYNKTLQRIAALSVPMIGDTCIVHIVEPNGRVRCVATGRMEEERDEPVTDVRRRTHLPTHQAERILEVLASGTSRVIQDAGEPFLPGLSSLDAEDRSILDQHWNVMSIPLVANESKVGVISFGSDVAKRAYGPSDIALAEELARRAALAVVNARLYRAAQDAVLARDEFLSIASHELRTPLTTLQLLVQGFRRAVQTESPPEEAIEGVRSSVELVGCEVARLDRLASNLLDVSRITAGRLPIERAHVDLSALVREVALRFEQEVEIAGCKLTVHADASVVGLWDRMRLDQIVTNLLSNAIKYGPGKPVEVRVESDATTGRIVVRDRGIGIAPKDATRIFERFERAVSARHYGGMGLGLYITRQIVEAHGGTIRVDSVPKEGSTFTVELPKTTSSLTDSRG
jgi:signal transduction histidine kinase